MFSRLNENPPSKNDFMAIRKLTNKNFSIIQSNQDDHYFLISFANGTYARYEFEDVAETNFYITALWAYLRAYYNARSLFKLRQILDSRSIPYEL